MCLKCVKFCYPYSCTLGFNAVSMPLTVRPPRFHRAFQKDPIFQEPWPPLRPRHNRAVRLHTIQILHQQIDDISLVLDEMKNTLLSIEDLD